MQKLALVFGAVALVGCVTEMPTGVQGEINGPCFANNTCNAGLVCKLVKSVGTCAPDPDASTIVDDGGTSSGDSGPRICSFQPSTFPCGNSQGMPPTACFGQAPMCTATGCGSPTDVRFDCFSPNQCVSAPCCIKASNATLVPTANCTLGGLQLLSPDAGGGAGTYCGQAMACPAGDTQLCQANGQCPAGKVCSPVKFGGAAPTSLSVITIGACVPQ